MVPHEASAVSFSVSLNSIFKEIRKLPTFSSLCLPSYQCPLCEPVSYPMWCHFGGSVPDGIGYKSYGKEELG